MNGEGGRVEWFAYLSLRFLMLVGVPSNGLMK
jgi:hypothetical protein